MVMPTEDCWRQTQFDHYTRVDHKQKNKKNKHNASFWLNKLLPHHHNIKPPTKSWFVAKILECYMLESFVCSIQPPLANIHQQFYHNQCPLFFFPNAIQSKWGSSCDGGPNGIHRDYHNMKFLHLHSRQTFLRIFTNSHNHHHIVGVFITILYIKKASFFIPCWMCNRLKFYNWQNHKRTELMWLYQW